MKTEYHGGSVAGGTFPAEIWGDYMKSIKGKFCGGFKPAKTAANFTPFFGKYARGGGRNTGDSSSTDPSSAAAARRSRRRRRRRPPTPEPDERQRQAGEGPGDGVQPGPLRVPAAGPARRGPSTGGGAEAPDG